MAYLLPIIQGIAIPSSEIDITTSRSGGPGGQHVNTADTRITLRWNPHKSTVFTQEQQERIIKKLTPQLTDSGYIIIHASESRSQHANKQLALQRLAALIAAALAIPKKRKKSSIPKQSTEKRLRTKAHTSTIKRARRSKYDDDE